MLSLIPNKQTKSPESIIKFEFRECDKVNSMCDLTINSSNSSNTSENTSTTKRSYGWIHSCISHDFYNKSITVSIDQQIFLNATMNSIERFAIESIRLSWNYYTDTITHNFPEMFTLLNIYTRFTISLNTF